MSQPDEAARTQRLPAPDEAARTQWLPAPRGCPHPKAARTQSCPHPGAARTHGPARARFGCPRPRGCPHPNEAPRTHTSARSRTHFTQRMPAPMRPPAPARAHPRPQLWALAWPVGLADCPLVLTPSFPSSRTRAAPLQCVLPSSVPCVPWLLCVTPHACRLPSDFAG